MKVTPSPQVKVIVKVNLPHQMKAKVEVNPAPQQSVEDVNLNPANRSLLDIINASVPYLSESPKEHISSFQKELSVVTSPPDLVEVFDESLDILASIVDGTATKEYA